jgi:hypothetical protein
MADQKVEFKPIKHTQDGRELREVANFRVRHRDYFHLKNLYIMLHEWLVEEGWATRDDEDFPETLYLQRSTQKSGDELWIWWRLKKDVNSKYFQYLMNVDYHVILLRDAEVMHQGQKFKTNWGEVELLVRAWVEIDYQKAWRNHWFLKNLHPVWISRIYKKVIDQHIQTLYREAYRFQHVAKTYCNMKTYLPEAEGEQFWPAAGLGDTK